MGCSIGAVYAGSPFDDIEIELENALFAKHEFGDWDQSKFSAFAKIGAARSEEQVFDKLLRDGGCAAAARALEVIFGGDLNLVPVEAVVLIEACVFSGDDGVLEFRGDLRDGKKSVPLVIWNAVEQGLNPALCLNCCGGWVDPAQGDEGEGGEGPAEGETNCEGEKDARGPDGFGSKGLEPRGKKPSLPM